MEAPLVEVARRTPGTDVGYGGVRRRTAGLLIDVVPVLILFVAIVPVEQFIVLELGIRSRGEPTGVDLAALMASGATIAATAVYFIAGWSHRRTLGMRLLRLQISMAADGTTVTLGRSTVRWVATFGWLFVSAGVFQTDDPTLERIATLLDLGWIGSLLWATARSPKRQGWHDRVSGSVVTMSSPPRVS